jgi:hypothetical protein
MGQAWTEFVFPWIVTGAILHVQVQFSCTCAKSCPFSRNTVKSCYCMERTTRWASHATQSARSYMYRVSMLHELGANDPIHDVEVSG